MRRLRFVLAVLVVGLAALGYCRGWFAVSDLAVTLDKGKMQEDVAKAKALLEGLKGQAESKSDGLK